MRPFHRIRKSHLTREIFAVFPLTYTICSRFLSIRRFSSLDRGILRDCPSFSNAEYILCRFNDRSYCRTWDVFEHVKATFETEKPDLLSRPLQKYTINQTTVRVNQLWKSLETSVSTRTLCCKHVKAFNKLVGIITANSEGKDVAGRRWLSTESKFNTASNPWERSRLRLERQREEREKQRERERDFIPICNLFDV